MKAKKKWNGSATTPVRLCRSSALRWVCFFGRKVKNSRKTLRCITTPETSAASITSAARPTMKMPRFIHGQFRL
ncbi:hypothetical protein Y695_03839 [Hydrogenophaga sp. T4]|nr:hypothetical protein Y695_03839 [Hydrogenophaga sp. T4]